MQTILGNSTMSGTEFFPPLKTKFLEILTSKMVSKKKKKFLFFAFGVQVRIHLVLSYYRS